MPSPVDRLWFDAHPGRDYRVRLATPIEVDLWPVPPSAGMTCKAVVRRSDLTVFHLTVPDPASFDDWADLDHAATFDEELDREAR